MEYYGQLFSTGDEDVSYGYAFAASKADMLPLCEQNGEYRWIQFGLNFQGDPAILVQQSDFPPPPMLTSAVMLAGSGIQLQWDDLAEDETGFEILRSESGGNWSSLGSVGGGVTRYTDTTVVDNRFYSYRVRTVNAAGSSIWSNEAGLVAGVAPWDDWDPGDDTASGATPLTGMSRDYQAHGPHTLSSNDTWDWYRIDMRAGYAYWLSAYREEAVGGLSAQLYSDDSGQYLVAEGGDLYGNEQFFIYYTPTISGTYYLRVRPNTDLDSAFYSLFYRERLDTSGSDSLGQAVNATSLVWQTSTDTGDPWYAQGDTSHDGSSAVQSGNVHYNESSWIRTKVLGTGTVGFWWKVSSQEDRDYLTFLVNGDSEDAISGETDWEYVEVDLEDSYNVLRWEFARSAAGSGGENTAWLDQFSFTPDSAVEDGLPISGILALGTDLIGPPEVGDGVTFTAMAMTPDLGAIYYRFDLVKDYGTTDYDPMTNWETRQNFSTSNFHTYAFTEPGIYVVIVQASSIPTIPVDTTPLQAGATVTVGDDSSISITGWDMDLAGVPTATGVPVQFEAEAISAEEEDIYYRFDLIPNYGTAAYDPVNNYQTIQDFSTEDECTHTFTSAGSYVVRVWASFTPSIPEGAAPMVGGTITIE
jgi:hypothetical protein